ncbi:MAG: potassium channel family protein [Terracidiphilus sp.]
MLNLTQKYRSELLMSALVVQLLASPIADKNPHVGGALAVVVLVLLLAGSSYTMNKQRDRAVLIALTAFWITMRLGEAFDGNRHIFSSLAPAIGLLLSCAVLRLILDRFGMISEITASVISEAFMGYLVIAIAFSQLYSILNMYLESPFNQVIPAWKTSTLLYFSMITLSSVGYGGVVPVNPYLRITAALESMVGIFYVAVVVARLVSSYRPKVGRISGNEV